MKILYVTHRYPPHTGGVETHVNELANRMAQRGHDVAVFTADANAQLTSTENKDVTVRRFRSVHLADSFYVCPQLAVAVRRAEVDVVHAHNYHAFPMFFAALGVQEHQFVATPHYHGGSANSLRDRLLSLYRPFGGWALGRADHVVAVSEWERNRLREDFNINATVIPNGVDVPRFSEAEPALRDRPYILSVGRLEEYKGIQHVIRALPELPEYELVIVGSGPHQDELTEVARRVGVADRVDFRGYVDNERLPQLFTGAEVYITMSRFEAYGMTVGEALSSGTPCVVRSRGALADWSDSAGVITVDSPAPKEISAAIKQATTLRGKTEAPTTWDEVVSRLLPLYEAMD